MWRKETKEKECKKALETKTLLSDGVGINYRRAILAKPTKINYSHNTEGLVLWECVGMSLSSNHSYWRTWAEEEHSWSHLCLGRSREKLETRKLTRKRLHEEQWNKGRPWTVVVATELEKTNTYKI